MPSKGYFTFFALSLFALLPLTAQAALTGTVTINGQVPLACNVIVSTETGATNIQDISAGDTNRLIATVNESCNDPDGYTVTVVGTHSGDHTGLFVDTFSSDTHPFTVNYNGTPVASGGVVTDATAAGINLNRPVTISYAADPTLMPSNGFTYAETLTFTIAAK